LVGGARRPRAAMAYWAYNKTQAVVIDLNCLCFVTQNRNNCIMDKLTKAQKDEFAVSFAILALYDGGVSRVLRCALVALMLDV
jgi:hypothetical protein